MNYDFIIIGAGASGLSTAALLEKNGYSVAILEAHSLPGGCSSYFERDGYVFDAGATTLSGFKEGRPLDRLSKELNLNLDIIAVDPGLVSIIDSKKIRRFSNLNKWINELDFHFPNVDNKGLWNTLKKIETECWWLVFNFKNIPLRSFKDLKSFFSFEIIRALKLLPYLFFSVDHIFKRFKISDKNYYYFINELLFITAQNKISDTPALMGAMGLCYPDDTYYAIGGMKAFSNSLATKCSNIFFKHEVKTIIPIQNGKNGFCIQTSKGDFIAKKVVSTLPFWNHQNLFNENKTREFFDPKNTFNIDHCWSAYMIYLTIPLDANRESLYFQIHCDEIPNCQTYSYFVSLSHPNDTLRSVNNRQTVTISTHTRSRQWLNLPPEQYDFQKKQTKDFILDSLKSNLNLESQDLQNILTGSPKSFLRYTKRNRGLVGGIPHSLKSNILKTIIAQSPLGNFYLIGDTQFPGQGIASVVLGAMNLVESIS